MQEDSSEFLSLEDDESSEMEKPQKSSSKPVPINLQTSGSYPTQSSDTIDAEVVDMTIVEEFAGNYTVTWPIEDMDCPDCAYKAMSALNRLPQVDRSMISATEGTVTLDVNFEKGSASEASAILSSLGNPPNLPYMQISGVKASDVASRHSVTIKRLPRIFKRQPGVLDCEVDKQGKIILQMLPEPANDLRIVMEDALKQIIGGNYELKEETGKRILPSQWRMIGAGFSFVMLVLVIISESLSGNRWLVGAFGLSGVLLGGFKMMNQAWASVKNRQLVFQLLTSLAVIGASILEAWSEALMVIILVAWTEHMKEEGLVKSRKAMQGGLDRIPRMARRVSKKFSGGFSIVSTPQPITPEAFNTFTAEEIPIGLVIKGDHLEIRSGELIPADGVIISGSGSINRAPLTGESVPVEVAVGDELQAGLTLARGPVKIDVTAVGDDTRLSGLIDKVYEFKEQPTRLQGAIESFTAIWIPVVLIGAFLAWLIQPGADPKLILLLWVVACPCALLLASPIPHAAGLARAARNGTIVRGGDVLESLSKVNLALIDKTGTLTSGKPRIGKITLSRGRKRESAIGLAAGIEASSNHPYAQSIISYASEEDIQPLNVSSITDGEDGVYAKLNGADVAFVRANESMLTGKLLTALKEAQKEGHGASLLTKEGKPVALFTFIHDDLRDGSPELIKTLYEQGINVEILSGDNQDAVNNMAREIGMPQSAVRGDMTPEAKVRWVQERSKTHITMMIGDGFNDAAAMAASDVGIAIGSGESTNLEAADVLVPGEDPRLISQLIDHSRKTNSVLMWNIVYSVAITLALVYGVLVDLYDNLAFGVLVHELSVIGVIVNGARLSGSGGTVKLIQDIAVSIWNGTVESYRTLFTINKPKVNATFKPHNH